MDINSRLSYFSTIPFLISFYLFVSLFPLSASPAAAFTLSISFIFLFINSFIAFFSIPIDF